MGTPDADIRGAAHSSPPAARDGRPDRRGGDPPGRTSGVAALSRIVDELRTEVAGLRTALRYRAVIEQAKGILTARTGMLPDDAFRLLVRRSQDVNRKLTAVAASVVADAIRWPEQPPVVAHDADLFPVTTEVVARIELAGAAFSAVPDVDALVRTIRGELADLDVGAVVLFASQADGSLRMLGTEGLDPRAVRGWDRIPLNADVPLSEAARTARPVLLADRATRLERHPGSRRVPSAAEATASLPLADGEQVVGVLGLAWQEPVDFDPELAERLVRTAARCTPKVRALLAGGSDELEGFHLEPGYDRWFQDLLVDLPHPLVLLEPRREDGSIVDLVVVHANPSATPLTAPPGTSLLTERPQLAGTGLLDLAREVLEGGPAWGPGPLHVPAAADGPSYRFAGLRIRRLGSLLLASWDHAAEDPGRG